ncbi:MAG: leucyl aminopeptidase [Elusimicrobia bacterium]|nr:leucyl aminopeptidase [Elusimicrobiota bacterium]
MTLTVVDRAQWRGTNQTLAIFTFTGQKSIATPWLAGLGRVLWQLASAEGFRGKAEEVAVLHLAGANARKAASRVLLVGLGDRERYGQENLRKAVAVATRKAEGMRLTQFGLAMPHPTGTPPLPSLEETAQAIAESVGLASYRYEKHRSKNEDRPPSIRQVTVIISERQTITAARSAIRQGMLFAEATNFARDLVNEPPSDLIPEQVAEVARSLGSDGTVEVKIFRKPEIERLGMGALLGVARGSAHPPVFLHLVYRPPKGVTVKRTVALAGKGITFDSGGLSLKSSEGMETMKMDMAGAAAILGVFRALPILKPPVIVHGFLSVAENMPGGAAMKPGDVVKALNGKTIEVLNTDAEGRLVLADALSYAVKESVDEIIDLATLTGACIVALGDQVAGAMGNREDLLERLKAAGAKVGEKLWPLPLVQEYREQLKSSVADMKNIAGKREAGAIIGGLFLQEFVGKTPWVHLDIAGPAWADKGRANGVAGGTGFGVRMLLTYLTEFTN